MDNPKDVLLIEILLKLAATNKLLVKKGILTDDEIENEMKIISKELIDKMKSSISNELEIFKN